MEEKEITKQIAQGREDFQEGIACAKALWHLIASCILRGMCKFIKKFKWHAISILWHKETFQMKI